MTAVGEQLDFSSQFADVWLPYRPLAGSKTGPKRRMGRDQALQQSYIEANVTHVLRSLVVVDHDGGLLDWVAKDFLPPSWVAARQDSQDGHLVFALRDKVPLTDAARRPPVNLLARIEHGMNTVLGGDAAYAGQFTKNPHHQDHLTLWGPAEATYSLSELADALRDLKAMPPAGQPRRHVTTSDVGRNCALFDITRRWAYPRRGDHTRPATWDEAVLEHALDRNTHLIAHEFTKGPLQDGEVAAIARSVSRWTWRNITRTRAAWHADQGRRSGTIRREKGITALVALDPELDA